MTIFTGFFEVFTSSSVGSLPKFSIFLAVLTVTSLLRVFWLFFQVAIFFHAFAALSSLGTI